MCLACNCSVEEPFSEVCSASGYIGNLCFACYQKYQYCGHCSKCHLKTEIINGKCVYQLPHYILLKKKLDDLLTYLANQQLIPNYLV
jgi:hypothetical protein